jgi:hypothetical protein
MSHRQLCKATMVLFCALSSLFGGSTVRADEKIRTARLDASLFQGWRMHRTWWAYGPPTCFSESGLGPLGSAITVVAGYDDVKDGNWYCGEQINTVYRGGVRFDLDQKGPDGKGFDGVPDGFTKAAEEGVLGLLRAVLVFNQERPAGPGCETRVYVANADWPSVLDDGFIPTTRSPDDYVDTIPPWVLPPPDSLATFFSTDVTDRVRSWLAPGTVPNFGFALVGPEENMDAEGNWTCLNTFMSFKLELVYVVHSFEKPPSKAIIPRRPRIPPPSERVVHTMNAGAMPPAFVERLRKPRAPQANPNPPLPRQ